MRMLHPTPTTTSPTTTCSWCRACRRCRSRFDVDLTTPDGVGTHDPGRRRQHDRRRRAADGRDRRPPRRHHRAAPGHPARRRRDGHRLRQVAPPGVRDADHAVAAAHDRRRPRADPQAGPRRGRSSSTTAAARSASSPSTTPPASTASPSCSNVMSRELVTVLDDGTDARDGLRAARRPSAARWRRWSTTTAAWSACVTRKGALRSTIYRPAVDADGRLMIAVAVGHQRRPGDQGQGARRRWASTCS